MVGYNHESYIEECLQSILDQTVAPEKILILDDCSPDGTAATASCFMAGKDIDFSIHRNTKNQGLCRTLNDALAVIETEFYAYISADDAMLPNRLEEQHSRFVKEPSSTAMVYSDALRFNSLSIELPELFSQHYTQSKPSGSDETIFERLLRGNWIPAPSVMLRTEAVRSVGGYDDQLFYEDHDLWLRLSRNYDVASIDSPLVKFRELETSLGSREFHFSNPKFIRAQLRVYAKHFDAEHADTVGPYVWNYAHRLWKANELDKSSFRLMRRSARYSRYPLAARLALLRAMLFRTGFSRTEG